VSPTIRHHPSITFTAIPYLSVLSFLPHFGAMPELQQNNGLVALQPCVLIILKAFLLLAYKAAKDHNTSPPRIPYHTSALSGEGWVHELLTGHPKRIRNELGVHWSTFIILVKALQTPEIGLQSSCHVLIEEQLCHGQVSVIKASRSFFK
jgi:hypothetical protein